MVRRLSAVEEGASGAAAAPTRVAARKATMYSMEDKAQIAAAPFFPSRPEPTPACSSATAARSMRASNSA